MTSGQLNRWVIGERGPKNTLDPMMPYAAIWEEETGADGAPVSFATLFLTNNECPYKCLMCDLWKNTLDYPTPLNAIPAQIKYALTKLPSSRAIKLYNAGSFFDTKAIPVSDYPAIANLVSRFDRVVVESHPQFVGERTLEFQSMIAGRLEVAIGLETIHTEVLRKLNKRFTVDDFQRSAKILLDNDIDLRVFILVRPPWMSEAEGVEWACRSLDAAFDAGAAVCCLIPTRGGNGAMERLAERGEFAQPTIHSLEIAMEYGLGLRKGRVYADLWDIDKFCRCECDSHRSARLKSMNTTQRVEPGIECNRCSSGVRYD